ncbi:TetR/AcrR family transcriptional regulator [Streptomyces sp. cg40]|uniref:TetR/AcrR family transcriptional regulator n=1 Tax=Streptomyces sp. cg40 TaxID=3419764 RepID=UPI003D021614
MNPRRAGALNERIDPRVTRTTRAFEEAVVELAARRSVSRISVAELAERPGGTRATFYNRYSSPLDLLIQVLQADLDRGHRRGAEARAQGGHSAAELLRPTTAEVADHVERYLPVYRHALADPADSGVYDALVRHSGDYTLSFMADGDHPGLPEANRRVVAQFLAHGFAGAIRTWLEDPAVTKDDLVDTAVACAPAWWTADAG